MDELEVVNRQGYQVTTLQQQTQDLKMLIACLLGESSEIRISPAQERLARRFDGISWDREQDGTIVIRGHLDG